MEIEKKKITLFVLFEENPYWFAIAGEAILKSSESELVKVVIFPMKDLMPASKYYEESQTLTSSHLMITILAKKLRRVIWVFFPSTKPSSKIRKMLQDVENVEIFDVNKKKYNFSNEVNSPAENHDSVVNSLLQSFFRTTEIAAYVPSKQIAKYRNEYSRIQGILKFIFSESKANSVCVINGRTFYESAAIEVASRQSLPAFSYEADYLATPPKILKFESHVLNYDFISREVEKFWDNYSDKYGYLVAIEEGSKFYERQKMDGKFNPFLKNFVESNSLRLPKDKEIVSLFTSSNDEWQSIFAFSGEDFPSQEDFIANAISIFSQESNNTHFLVIRVHPNLVNKRDLDKLFYQELISSEKVRVINFDSKISSYELLELSDKVISTASTIGLEASFMGKPSFSLNKSIGGICGATISLGSIMSVLEWKGKEVESESRRLQSIKYGLFCLHWGEYFKYVDPKEMRTMDDLFYFDIIRHLTRRVRQS